MTTVPTQAWTIENSMLVAQSGVPNIDLMIKETYKNFELSLE